MTNEKQGKLIALEFLIGSWKGKGRGFGNESEVENSFEYVLDSQFIRSKTRSVAKRLDGEIEEVHEDWGMFSYDPERDAIVLREFYSEGYVNVYLMEEVDEPGNLLVFTSEKTEGTGGLRARLRYQLLSESVCKVALDLARPGEEFRQCQLVEMTRVN